MKRADLKHIYTDAELKTFAGKVEKWRAEGLTFSAIGERVGLSGQGVQGRLKTYRDRCGVLK